ncbi:hypothetical protein INT47_009868 [Mucor saturninus]|uniref:Uncharacterized protein n=1 Tax=Mucor saturninus TaxID=64648 RepID=A0A8H7QXS9_9FUNG|nr:hypothetical protein INT47_009868 [Mucor saturninus]
MSIIITTPQEFEQFYNHLDAHQTVGIVTIYTPLEQAQLDELKTKLPNTTISYHEPDDEEEEEEHGDCACHRNDRYE